MINKKKIGSAVFVYIFNTNFSKILLEKRNLEKRSLYGFDWGLIGGKLEIGENIISGLLREVKEEIGKEFFNKNLVFVKKNQILKGDIKI